MEKEEYPSQILHQRSLGSVVLQTLKQQTWGSLTFDLKRSHVLDDAFEDSAEESGLGSTSTENVFVPLCETAGNVEKRRPRERFSANGARFKVMRHVSLGPCISYQRHGEETRSSMIDLGVGASFELDSARIRPKARVRILRSVSIGLFPCPHLKIQRRIPIGLTGFSIRGSYFCPLREMGTFYRHPARLIITLDDDQNYGIRLSHAGVELAGNTWVHWHGWNGYLQASGVVHLPNMLDLQGGRMMHPYVEPMRCGLKTFW